MDVDVIKTTFFLTLCGAMLYVIRNGRRVGSYNRGVNDDISHIV